MNVRRKTIKFSLKNTDAGEQTNGSLKSKVWVIFKQLAPIQLHPILTHQFKFNRKFGP